MYYMQDESTGEILIPVDNWETKKGSQVLFGINLVKAGLFDISIVMKSELGELAQLPVSVYLDNALKTTISVRGLEGATLTETRDIGMIFGNNHYIKLYFGASGLEIESVKISLREEI